MGICTITLDDAGPSAELNLQINPFGPQMEVNFGGTLGTNATITIERKIGSNLYPVANSWANLTEVVVNAIPLGGLTFNELSREQSLVFTLNAGSSPSDITIQLLGMGTDTTIEGE